MHPQDPQTNGPFLPALPSATDSTEPTGTSPARIHLEDVTVTAHGTLLLPLTTFRAMPGQIGVVRGENGSGKTTLLRTLAGRIKPTTGTIQINGQAVNERDTEFRRRVAVMIGLPPLASDLTVFDHVALVASTWEESPGSVKAATRRVLDEFGLTALGARYPHELSSGQTQLFGLALVFVRPFDVLLLDEPEQRLDPSRVDLLAQAMLARRSRGATIVVATHSARLAVRTADFTITLEGGQA